MLFSALPSEYFIDASLLAPRLTAYDIQNKNENKEKRMPLLSKMEIDYVLTITKNSKSDALTTRPRPLLKQ